MLSTKLSHVGLPLCFPHPWEAVCDGLCTCLSLCVISTCVWKPLKGVGVSMNCPSSVGSWPPLSLHMSCPQFRSASQVNRAEMVPFLSCLSCKNNMHHLKPFFSAQTSGIMSLLLQSSPPSQDILILQSENVTSIKYWPSIPIPHPHPSPW